MVDFIAGSKEDILIMGDNSADFVREVRAEELDFKIREFVKLEGMRGRGEEEGFIASVEEERFVFVDKETDGTVRSDESFGLGLGHVWIWRSNKCLLVWIKI